MMKEDLGCVESWCKASVSNTQVQLC